jgi:hypothetical protein
VSGVDVTEEEEKEEESMRVPSRGRCVTPEVRGDEALVNSRAERTRKYILHIYALYTYIYIYIYIYMYIYIYI